MEKSELRKKRMLYATSEMMQKAAVNEQKTEGIDRWGNKRKFKRMYRAFLRIQYLQGILKVAVFMPEIMRKGIRTPKYEIFINPDGNEYITRELDESGMEVKWRTAMIDNLYGFNYWQLRDCKEAACINAEGRENIRIYLKAETGGFYDIAKWQQACREQKIKDAEAREQKPWDDDMKLIPEIPERFKRWMGKEVPEENYIFYKYQRGGAKSGYCTYCQKEVPLKEVPKHRKEGTCLVCGKDIKYISTGKLKNIRTQYNNGQLIQKIPGGIVIREFRIRKQYDTVHPERTYVGLHEEERWLYRDGKMDHYSYMKYKNKYTRWCKQDLHYCEYGRKSKIFKENLPGIESDISRQSALNIIIRDGVKISAVKYLKEEQGNPAIEKLVKIGMTKLALGLINAGYDVKLMNQNQTELAKMLKIDRNRLKRLKEMDAGIVGLRWMQMEKAADTVFDDEMIQFFEVEHVTVENLDFLKKKRLSYKKIQNYLIRQKEETGDSVSQLITTWRDYLKMADKLNMRTDLEEIYKPRSLYAAHAEVIEILEKDGIDKMTKELEKKWPKVNEVCKTLGKYEWSDGEYSIVAPKNMRDIVREGTILKHCIHTCDYYIDRIGSREAYILFLRHREAPDAPWYTLEIEPGGNIRQKRTTGDNQNKDLDVAMKFLRKWQKVIQKRLSDEDKELAAVSEKKRRENYKNLRENGNRIWHGKLQGQLLADVLEQDFMAVI